MDFRKTFVSKHMGVGTADLESDVNSVTNKWRWALENMNNPDISNWCIVFDQEEDHILFALKFSTKHGQG